MTSLPGDQQAPLLYRFSSARGHHVMVVPYSRVFDLPQGWDESIELEGRDFDPLARPVGTEAPLDQVPECNPQNLSLNVSSSCNLTCGYCYASRGSFEGAQPAPMSWPTAKAAIDRLLAYASRERPITIGFLGGEPFVNRRLIHQCVGYSAHEAVRLGLDIRFSVTTNGTLLEASDRELLRSHPFAVTVSLDGGESLHNRQRAAAGLRTDSWKSTVEHLGDLLANPGRAYLSARATVTRASFDLRERLEALAAVGFTEIGFAPVRAGRESAGPLTGPDWGVYLASLIDAANAEVERAHAGQSIRLSNLLTAIRQIHIGASSPYPCGAGGGYFSISADGRWYACHRAIGNPAYELGDNSGLATERRRDFLAARHVHAQTDCRLCWARYLCSGGCHQEAATRTQSSCDFVRGWLTYLLRTYCECGSLLLRVDNTRARGGTMEASS